MSERPSEPRLVAPEAGGEMESYVVFEWRGTTFAAEIGWVREVVGPSYVAPYPVASCEHLGVISVRGTVLPVRLLEADDEARAPGPGQKALRESGLQAVRCVVLEPESGLAFGVPAERIRIVRHPRLATEGTAGVVPLHGAPARVLRREELRSAVAREAR